jgi:hypothetical protein
VVVLSGASQGASWKTPADEEAWVARQITFGPGVAGEPVSLSNDPVATASLGGTLVAADHVEGGGNLSVLDTRLERVGEGLIQGSESKQPLNALSVAVSGGRCYVLDVRVNFKTPWVSHYRSRILSYRLD